MSRIVPNLEATLELASVVLSADVPAGRYEMDAYAGAMPPDGIALVTIKPTFRPEVVFVLIPEKK